MSRFLIFVFIFFIGSMLGWVLELFYRRIAHKKWINPGFLVGPYLPIYGFGLSALTFGYLLFYNSNLSPIIIIIIMGLLMTLIEFVTGIIFIHGAGIKLWDYSDRWLNYKGIICPLFSLIWTVTGGLYYFFIAPSIIRALEWFSKNLSFSFILGMFVSVVIVDFIYSTKLLGKIRKFAKENDIEVKYEEFKAHIKEVQQKRREKYSFIFALHQKSPLSDYLKLYKKDKK